MSVTRKKKSFKKLSQNIQRAFQGTLRLRDTKAELVLQEILKYPVTSSLKSFSNEPPNNLPESAGYTVRDDMAKIYWL